MARGPIPDFPRDRPTVPEVAPLIKRFYERDENFNGGVLHVVLEDGNLDTCFIDSCAERAWQERDALGWKIAYLMRQMTLTQRRKLYRMSSWTFVAIGDFRWRTDL